jgi:nicotinamide-nucleotide amidase
MMAEGGPGRRGAVMRIIAVGDELLEGRTSDTNSGRIQRALGRHAVQTADIQVVPDTRAAIARALGHTSEGDLVFLTGGLGSTPDDLTRDAVAEWAGVPLDDDARVLEYLEERWRKRGVMRRPGVARQSQVPRGLHPVMNPVGSAPGLIGDLAGRTLILLPGVPSELEGFLPVMVRWLEEQGRLPAARPTLVWRTAQIAELSLVELLKPVEEAYPELAWSWWLTDWGVDVRLAADPEADDANLQAAGARVDELLGHLVYSRRHIDLPAKIQETMIARGLTLSVAESCTSGLIGARFTDAAGSSGFFRGGILAYADQVKQDLLGVPAEVLRTEGAVSEAVVKAMADGCRRKVGTDYALAVSGISGPGGGSEEKPVGTTWIGVACPGTVHAGRYHFPANRFHNRRLTVAAAMDTLRRVLQFGDQGLPWYRSDTWVKSEVRADDPRPGA